MGGCFPVGLDRRNVKISQKYNFLITFRSLCASEKHSVPLRSTDINPVNTKGINDVTVGYLGNL